MYRCLFLLFLLFNNNISNGFANSLDSTSSSSVCFEKEEMRKSIIKGGFQSLIVSSAISFIFFRKVPLIIIPTAILVPVMLIYFDIYRENLCKS